jgi:SAM-dependent methyltransferase
MPYVGNMLQSCIMSLDWLPLQRHYERCLALAGATPLGVDWPNGLDLAERFNVQLQILSAVPAGATPPTLLDLGCGPGLLLDYLAATGRANAVEYHGIDISPAMVALGRRRWPEKEFQARDIVADPLPPESVDVVIMNGVLTERQDIPRDRMVLMAETLLRAAFRAARYGVAFNAMSRHVDWERDDLFHWGFDEAAAFLKRDLTRHMAFRADYGLYEFTAFAWRHPQRSSVSADGEWWKQ